MMGSYSKKFSEFSNPSEKVHTHNIPQTNLSNFKPKETPFNRPNVHEKKLSAEKFISGTGLRKKSYIPKLNIIKPIQEKSFEYESALKLALEREIGTPLSDKSVVIPITKAKVNPGNNSSPPQFYTPQVRRKEPETTHRRSKTLIKKNLPPINNLNTIEKKEEMLQKSIRALNHKKSQNHKKNQQLRINSDRDEIINSLQQIDDIVQSIKSKIGMNSFDRKEGYKQRYRKFSP